ncbi:MAG: PTS sugar transporter subunit IIC [candidate division WOR-3 bacterium]|nr:PTS sugar transporter subunit IIC [candidate division WOR-3 bacterium]
MSPQLTIAVLCILSGVLMLDKYSFGEFGVSQPLVAASVLGFAAGDFVSGALLGVLLQPVWLLQLPIGRKVPLDAQAAGISGAVAFFTMRILANPAFEAAALAAIVVAAAASVWGGWFDRYVRRLNGVLARRLEQISHRRRLLFLHIAALDISFLRGVLLALLAAGIGIVILPLLKLLPLISLERLFAATLSVGLASGLVLFGIKKRLLPFFVGFTAWVVVWALVRF